MIPEIERKAILALQPYFDKEPIVIDVGSNKGDWADVLIRNVRMILFEPNEILLHYSMVRFDTIQGIVYNSVALSDKIGLSDFFFFTNNNNGLSSLYYNKFWEDQGLPMQKGTVRTTTLDDYYERTQELNPGKSFDIDMLKIDVEGADYDVLVGAKNLLQARKIKFISIEKSPHYALAGRTFDDVIDFVSQFGYAVFHFNGNQFEPYTNQDAENLYIMDKNFTQDWNGEFIRNTATLPKVQTALEIGCFEGLTTSYICNNLLKDGGRIVCVDPLTDEYLPGHKDNEMFVGQYDRFIRNTAGYPVELVRKKSIDAFQQLKDLRFGLIYIDGDHTEEGVFSDGTLYWNLLLDGLQGGGYMLFDDYGQSPETARGINRFLESQKGNYELLIKDYQVLIKRTK